MKSKILIILVCFSALIIISFTAWNTNVVFTPGKTNIQIKPIPVNVYIDSVKHERENSLTQAPKINALKPEIDDGINVLSVALAMNAADMPKPDSTFRDGIISSTDISNYLTKTPNGYIIQMPNHTNIPTPTIQKGTLYVSGGFGSKQYYAFNGKSGQKVWAVNLDDDGPSSCVIADDVIVFNTESCTIFACESTTGKYLWSHWLGDPLMSMPTVANGKVFTAYPSAKNSSFSKKVNYNKQEKTFHATHVLASFDLKTGKVLWQKWIDGDVMSAPVAEENFLYATTFPGTVYKLDQKTGDILSVKYMRATSAPVINGSEIMLSRRADTDKGERYEEISHMDVQNSKVTRVYMKKKAVYLDSAVQRESNLKSESQKMDAGNGFAGGAPLSSGARVAEENIGQSNVSSLQSFQGSRVVFYDGKNYNTMGDEIICTEPASGNVLWKSKLDGDLKRSGGFLGAPPVSVGGYIIVATFAGEVQVINAETGEIEEKYNTENNIRYQPIVDDGWIYVTTTNGKLIAINTNNPKLSGWTTWGGNAAHTNKVL